jgi:hypothetical protein
MTQGVVSILLGGRVHMKIIAGCNGMNAERVAKEIRRLKRVPGIAEAHEIAKRLNFGAPESLVIVTESDIRFDGEETLDNRYRDTFDRPEFNPRWDKGTADHVELVYL